MLYRSHARRSTRTPVARAAMEAVEGRRLFATPTAFTGLYDQNFDGLASQTATVAVGATNANYNLETINPSLAGWQVARAGGSGSSISLFNSNGSSNTGGLYNYGATSGSDRALGALGSGSNFGRYGVLLTNTTSEAITEFTLTFDLEVWRVGGSTNELHTFGYKLGATSISDASGWVGNSTLNLTTIGAVGASQQKTATITGLNWAPGQTLGIRWQDADSGGSDNGLAVDNLSVTAPTVPDGPGSLTISPSSVSVNEDAGTVSFTVDRLGGTEGTVSADILLTPGTASTADFGAPSVAQVVFSDGDDASKTFTVQLVDDSRYELSESFSASLVNPQGTAGAPSIGNATSVVTILDAGDSFLFQESFESAPGTTYTLEGPTGAPANFEYFDRFLSPDSSNSARDDFTGGFDGSYAIQGQNHSGDAWGGEGDPTRTVAITDIDISGYEDLNAFFSLGALASEPQFQNWNITDGISIYATIDGGARTLIGQFKPSTAKGDLKLDTDLDGVGDGVTLTGGSLQNFVFAVPGTGSNLTLEVDATTVASFQAWALDNVRVEGLSTGVSLPAWVAPGSLATWNAGTQTLTVTGATTIIADPGAGNASIIADGTSAVVTFEPTSDQRIHLAGLALSGGATAELVSVGGGRSPIDHRLLSVDASGFAIDSTSSLDLNDNDMVLRNATSATNTTMGELILGGQVTSDADNFFTALGYGLNDGSAFFQYDFFGPGATNAEREAVTPNDLLVKFTHAGDGNLDGRVDADDLFYVDFNFGNTIGSSWSTGDFNNDGRTDADDLFFIDFNLGSNSY